MDEYVNAYAHSNLHEALLAALYAFVIGNESDPSGAFFELRGDVAGYLKSMRQTGDRQDENWEQIRGLALGAIPGFFWNLGDVLVSQNKLTPEEAAIARRMTS